MPFPTPLGAYPPASPDGLLATLANRVALDPFNAVASGIFFLAIVHTFAAARFTEWAHRVQERHDRRATAAGLRPLPSVLAETLLFFGEVEVVFGLWAVVLVTAIVLHAGASAAAHYLNDSVTYTEPLFVVVIMALASTRPIIGLAESALRRVAAFGGGGPAACWCSILTVGPLLGSFITEPGAITISALLLGRTFFAYDPGVRLKYATIGLLFVNVSIGGILTHFAAPPVLMVSRVWGWNARFMFVHFGWRAIVAIGLSTVVYFLLFRRELLSLASRDRLPDADQPDEETRPGGLALLPVPGWITAVHLLFLAWTVATAHYPALCLGAFLFFLGFARATSVYQSRLDLRRPLLIGFFLAGLVIHGGLQGWWIAPVLAHLRESALYLGAAVLTTFNDNALITYLATLTPEFGQSLKLAVVGGAVTGGGLTVIANAPNPAGQAILSKFFGGAVAPLGLAAAALVPTLVTIVVFRLV